MIFDIIFSSICFTKVDPRKEWVKTSKMGYVEQSEELHSISVKSIATFPKN
jgi:hypothetical protein